LEDIKNIPNVSNKALKMDKKEQEKIVEFLSTPNKDSPNKNKDLEIQSNSFIKSRFKSNSSQGNEEAQNLREQLVKMITDQINSIEDKNVKN